MRSVDWPSERAVGGLFRMAGALGALFIAGVALGQTSQPVEEPAKTIPYVDPTFGFELRLPAGWTYDRARFQGPEGALGLLRGERRDVGRALQILVYRNLDMPGFPEWLQAYAKKLGELYGVKKIQVETWEREARPRAVLTFDAKVGGELTRTHYACLSLDPHTVWVLALAGKVHDAADEKLLRAEFDDVFASVHVTFDPLEAIQISAAFDRGLNVLQELAAKAATVELDAGERYFDVMIGGKSTGYLVRWMRRDSQALSDPRVSGKAKEGLHVHEESGRFGEDGTVRFTELDLFNSFDLRSEMIENRATQVPAPDVPSQRLYIELDQCIREDKVLFSSFSTNLDIGLPDPRPPILVGPRYLSLAWVRLLPRLLLKAPAETYAFAVYDTQARALTVLTIRPMGETRIPGQPDQPGLLFETREGFAALPSKLFTDARGEMLRIEAGDLVITRTTRADIERKYAARRDPAWQRTQSPPRPRGGP